MDDARIIELYFERDEMAISETRNKYGRLLMHIANNILSSDADAEECVDDTYVRTWNAIPPERPTMLSAFLSKITRNLAINRYRKSKREKRMTDTEHVYEEIAECIPDNSGDLSDTLTVRNAINGFLSSIGTTPRKIFVKRYFYMCDIKKISHEMGISQVNVRVTLSRCRDKLKKHLEEAGICI